MLPGAAGAQGLGVGAAGAGLAGAAATTCTDQESDTATCGQPASQSCLYTDVPRPREIGAEFRYPF